MFWDTVSLTDEITLRKKVLIKRINVHSRSKKSEKVKKNGKEKYNGLHRDYPPVSALSLQDNHKFMIMTFFEFFKK